MVLKNLTEPSKVYDKKSSFSKDDQRCEKEMTWNIKMWIRPSKNRKSVTITGKLPEASQNEGVNFDAVTLGQSDISSTWHFINAYFHHLVISSMRIFISLSSHQCVFSSPCHFIDAYFHHLVISSNCFKLTHQFAILSACYFINLTFHHLFISSNCF